MFTQSRRRVEREHKLPKLRQDCPINPGYQRHVFFGRRQTLQSNGRKFLIFVPLNIGPPSSPRKIPSGNTGNNAVQVVSKVRLWKVRNLVIYPLCGHLAHSVISTSFLKHGLLLRRSRRETHLHRVGICPKDSHKPLALAFPDTSLFIKVVRSSECKIDEKAALFDPSHSSKSMILSEMNLGHPSPSALFPPTTEGFSPAREV
jgi:hypothetical protein